MTPVVAIVRDGLTVTEVTEKFAVSRQSIYRSMARYEREDSRSWPSGLTVPDRVRTRSRPSSRPGSSSFADSIPDGGRCGSCTSSSGTRRAMCPRTWRSTGPLSANQVFSVGKHLGGATIDVPWLEPQRGWCARRRLKSTKPSSRCDPSTVTGFVTDHPVVICTPRRVRGNASRCSQKWVSLRAVTGPTGISDFPDAVQSSTEYDPARLQPRACPARSRSRGHPRQDPPISHRCKSSGHALIPG